MGRWPATGAGALCGLMAMPLAWRFVPAWNYRQIGAGGPVVFAMLVGLGAVLLYLGRNRWPAAVFGAAGTVVLLAKPIVHPIRHDRGSFTLTSETHLYYLVPAVLFSLLTLTLALARPLEAKPDGSVPARWGVVLAMALAGVLSMLTFVGGRGDSATAFTLFVPGLLLVALAIVVAVRGGPVHLVSSAAAAWPSPSGRQWNPEWSTGFPSGANVGPTNDPAASVPFASGRIDAVLAAVAEAPGLSDEDLAGARFGPYEVLGTLGVGGMGRVYRARDHRLLRDVALKLLPAGRDNPRRRRRLLREAQAAAQLNHPNIAQIHDVSVDGDRPYIVMELCEGTTLRARLDYGPLPPEHLWSLGRQIAEALAVAHARGIVHRDLKPENVIVSETGHAKVLDFGLARLDDPGDGTESPGPNLTMEGAVVGTPGYMSPEQRRGLPVDARADVYAFGVLLHELATGTLPSQPGAALSPALAPLITATLQPDPNARPADGAALCVALAG